jgi:glycogen debranching enzyme
VSEARVPHPIEVLYGHGVALACGLDGAVSSDELHGLFAGDTRVLSTYRMIVGGERWQLLGRARSGSGAAEWTFQSPAIRDPREGRIPEAALVLHISRRVAGALHDDIAVTSYADEPVRTTLVVQLDADFADVFEVKDQSVPARLGVRRVPRPGGVEIVYEHSGFRRGIRVTLRASSGVPELVGSLIAFDLELAHGRPWKCCVEAEPQLDGEVLRFVGDPHGEGDGRHEPPVGLRAAPVLERPFACGCSDLRSLALDEDGNPPYLAAGVPWFYTLFGRDSLLPAVMTGLTGSWPARGSLSALGRLQAREHDDWRDAEPGKIPHELRRGELAHLDLSPHTPYYGTHDAPALYCLALWNAWRWTSDDGLLDAHLETARAALRWCDEHGDRDGDGLQEYATRSRRGYYNQSWKDAGDAIVHADGRTAELPLAPVELQGYLFAARLALAELIEERGEASEAEVLRARAAELRDLVEERYWSSDDGFYVLALDGKKRAVASITSNPGQLLWTGLPTAERARAVAQRLLADDLFTGWGIRTLSSEHPSYNPMSYQRGSVWPHDTALAAAGMARYGLHDEAARLLEAILDAACAFEGDRLPELFCGFRRTGAPPVPYREANVPQAWAAAVPILAAQLLLGLVPDAPRGRCHAAPQLPEWLPRLELEGVRVGSGRFDIAVGRRGNETMIERLDASGVEVVTDQACSPLWGLPRSAGEDR